jgi:RimJ/RimL family protein N-acetyltransferase
VIKWKGSGKMRLEPVKVRDKQGREMILKSAEAADGEALIRFMKITAGETPFLIREPGEFHLTLEEEQDFVRSCEDNPRALLLLGIIDGQHVGSCSVMGLGPFRRYGHRCQVAIALYRKYWGAGIGELMMEKVLSAARDMGYEQAELEVISSNTGALALYRKLGFKEYGTFPRNMKYGDGQYGDACWMMKQLS